MALKAEFQTIAHFICVLPVAQQVIGLTQMVYNLGLLVFRQVELSRDSKKTQKNNSVTLNISFGTEKKRIEHDISLDKSDLLTGFLRFIPVVGTIYSIVSIYKECKSGYHPI